MHAFDFLLDVLPRAFYSSTAMSISVEDLVCSLSSSHIGQEAMDLAALQAQLAQAFFNQSTEPSSSSQKSSSEPFYQPCNTPTGRTSSTSFSWAGAEAQRVSRWNSEEMTRELDDVEDERMVEDILLPSSPVSAGVSSTFPTRPRGTSRSQSRNIPKSPSSPSFSPETSSIFTSTDPFYLAQLQAMQTAPSSSSVFSQLGRPSQQSPFVNQQQRYESFPYGSTISLETRNMFAATSVAVER
ncbi:hypothetical protein L218DRAFT_995049 [Marasmius fiardii PR-910]|nr:hypothetical protein L218DRAFT_995049 [Marasmius fiardii PR-910]